MAEIKKRTVVDHIIETLYQYGVRHVFGIPGDAINDLMDAIRRHGEIEFIQVRHEESGAFAASA
ncbi:MAG: pyruvate oxidase, partial [Gammaproteobacteria bacterium]